MWQCAFSECTHSSFCPHTSKAETMLRDAVTSTLSFDFQPVSKVTKITHCTWQDLSPNRLSKIFRRASISWRERTKNRYCVAPNNETGRLPRQRPQRIIVPHAKICIPQQIRRCTNTPFRHIEHTQPCRVDRLFCIRSFIHRRTNFVIWCTKPSSAGATHYWKLQNIHQTVSKLNERAHMHWNQTSTLNVDLHVASRWPSKHCTHPNHSCRRQAVRSHVETSPSEAPSEIPRTKIHCRSSMSPDGKQITVVGHLGSQQRRCWQESSARSKAGWLRVEARLAYPSLRRMNACAVTFQVRVRVLWNVELLSIVQTLRCLPRDKGFELPKKVSVFVLLWLYAFLSVTPAIFSLSRFLKWAVLVEPEEPYSHVDEARESATSRPLPFLCFLPFVSVC